MSKCPYCGQDAGWLHKVHKECQEKHDAGLQQIKEHFQSAADGTLPLDVAHLKVEQIAADSVINQSTLQHLAIGAFESAINHALADDLLSEKEEKQLGEFISHFDFGISIDELSKNPVYMRMVKAAVLRDITEGKIPERLSVDSALPFNFQKSERLIWLFQHVEYLQPRTHTTYQGRTNGVSVRIAKGLYFRTSQFSGNPIATTQLTRLDCGLLAVTTKHIYFAGAMKSLRIRYDKIISFVPFSDGVGVQRENVSKADVFVTNDGWFTHNLLVNLAQFEPA